MAKLMIAEGRGRVRTVFFNTTLRLPMLQYVALYTHMQYTVTLLSELGGFKRKTHTNVHTGNKPQNMKPKQW